MYYVWILVKIIFFIPYHLLYWSCFKNKRELRKHRGKGVVIVCNHKSFSEPPLMFMSIHRKVNFPIKEELLRKKFWKFFFTTIRCFPVKQGNDMALMRYCLKALKQKEAVFIFPEGRRVSDPEDALAVRNGASMMAIKGGVPVLPMVINRAPRPFRLTKVKIGTTISTEEYQNKRLEKSDLADLSAKIQTSMAELLEGFEKRPKDNSVISRGIVFKDEKLLAIKRVKKDQEYYVFPGGHIDNGETARDATVREVKEETDVDVAPVRLLYKYKFFNRKGNPRANGMQSFYLCNYVDGTPQPTDAEEYTDTTRDNGTYEPTLLDIETLKTVDLRPVQIKDQLIKDIEKFGFALTRATKHVK